MKRVKREEWVFGGVARESDRLDYGGRVKKVSIFLLVFYVYILSNTSYHISFLSVQLSRRMKRMKRTKREEWVFGGVTIESARLDYGERVNKVSIFLLVFFVFYISSYTSPHI